MATQDAGQRSNNGAHTPSAAELQLEKEKLSLERTKTWLTAVSIVLPVLAAAVTFMVTNQQSLNQARIERARADAELRFKFDERRINSRIEFVKLVAEKPKMRREIMRDWRLAFPDDRWLDSTAEGSHGK